MKGPLPHWLEQFLGVDPAESGEGTAWSLDHAWNWAPWVTLLFALFCIGLVGWLYLREHRGSGRFSLLVMVLLRLAAVAVVLLMIAELSLSRQRTGLPYVAVLIDDSASMATVDRYAEKSLGDQLNRQLADAGLEGLSRLNLAKAILLRQDGALLNGIEDRYKLRLYYVAGSARAQSGSVSEISQEITSLEATGESSRLGVGVRTVLDDLRGTPPTAIVLLTDGITTEGESLTEAAAYARRKNVPLFNIAIGSSDPLKNIKLHDLLVDEDVFVNDVVNFEYKLTASGLKGRTVQVVLREKDKPETLASMSVTLGEDNQTQRLNLPYRPTQVGEFRYIVEATPLSDEEQPEDNAEERTLHVHEGQIKVLLVQSYPNYEYRYLKHMLERDQTIRLRTVLQEADLKYAQEDSSALQVFPVRREKLNDEDDAALFYYDCVIFGDVNPAFLSQAVMQNLADFVKEQGRGVVFMAGPMYTPSAYRDMPLAPLMPVDLGNAPPPNVNMRDGFQVLPTELGLGSPHMQLGDSTSQTAEIWRNLPDLFYLYEAARLKPAARVLAEHPTRIGTDGKPLPIIAVQYVGKGKVLFHGTDETWRWRYRVGDVFFARYWVQAIRYLSRSKLRGEDNSAELTADRREYRRGESVRLRVQFLDDRSAPLDDDGVAVVIERAGQPNQQLTLHRSATSRGVFEGVFPSPADGAYHAWVATPTFAGGSPSADFQVVAPPGEYRQLQIDPRELVASASATKGKFYTPATAGTLLDDLPEGRQVPIESLEPIVLWNKWPLVFVFTALLVTEWVLRKRRGLL
ncbi:MAG: VWA domain-containing protein [Pirellulales bacterium]